MSKILVNFRTNDTFKVDLNRLANTYLGLLFTFSSAIAALCLLLFKCADNPNGKKTLTADLTVDCFEGKQWTDMVIVGIACVLIYVIGFIALLSWVLYVSAFTERFAEPGFQMRWKFLFIKFRPDVHWWAMACISRGVLLNVGFVIFLHAVWQIYWIMTVSAMYLVLLIRFMPYRSRLANFCEVVAVVSIMFSGSVLLWFVETDHEADPNNYNTTLSSAGAAISFLPMLASALAVAHYAYNGKLRTAQALQETARNCENAHRRFQAFAKLNEDARLQVFSQMGEWDRWFVVNGARVIASEASGERTTVMRTITASHDHQPWRDKSGTEASKEEPDKPMSSVVPVLDQPKLSRQATPDMVNL